ncbi:SCO2322 family protein [Kitasatospora misakiensis]|uniref:SCO2322 family protein n=1 Tax=Kitasatospora misakiensis TaxID=67330 RepID=A0ABW0XEM6_9ACTN
MTTPGRPPEPPPATAAGPAPTAGAGAASGPAGTVPAAPGDTAAAGSDAAAAEAQRRVVRAAVRFLAGLITGVLILLLIGAAQAQAAGYRYWSFWRWSDGGWAYQQQGPAVHVPADGAVDGWRFAVSPDGGRDAARPGTAGDFAAVCAGTPAEPGRKRVAVVLDFGAAADAPGRETPPEPRTVCAVVQPRASSAEVLATVAPPLRYDGNGLLCAIAGYPRAGCGDQLGAGDRPTDGGQPSESAAPTAAGASPATGGPVLGVGAGLALVLVVAAGAARQVRRRR